MTNEEIYDQCASSLERFFVNKVTLDQDVDDLLQKTFERFFAKRTEGREIHEPCAFLGGIAKNVLLEYWREKSRLERHEDIGEHSLVSLGSGISTLFTRNEDQQLVLNALREVKLNYQLVLELYYWENRSYQEIADILNISLGTAGTWLRRGREALRRVIERMIEVRGPLFDAGAIGEWMRHAKNATTSRRGPSPAT